MSWDAWPKAGQSRMTSVEDMLYKGSLGGKTYMMGVSPWFYTGRFALQGTSFPILTIKPRFGPVEQALVLLERVPLVRSMAAGSGSYA